MFFALHSIVSFAEKYYKFQSYKDEYFYEWVSLN